MGNVRAENAMLMPHEIEIIKINQGIINRMADNSLKCKQFFMGIVAALLIFYGNNIERFNFVLVIFFVFITAVFWYMDAKYLQLERMFRKHHNAIVAGCAGNLTMWKLNPMPYKKEVPNMFKTMCSFSLIVYPIAIIIGFVVSLFF